MKAKNQILSTVLLVALTFASGCQHAGERKTSTTTDRAIERRAVAAVIWGMPLNYERMLQAAITNGANANQVVYWSKPVNEKNQTLTPNPDTIYLNPFYDTHDGPVVLETPCRRSRERQGSLAALTTRGRTR